MRNNSVTRGAHFEMESERPSAARGHVVQPDGTTLCDDPILVNAQFPNF